MTLDVRSLQTICISTILLCVGFAAGADLDSAKHAFQQQDYSTALMELVVLAEQGNAEAQVLLGKMYLTGRGVLKDPHAAVKWSKAAAEQGNNQAIYEQDLIAVGGNI